MMITANFPPWWLVYTAGILSGLILAYFISALGTFLGTVRAWKEMRKEHDEMAKRIKSRIARVQRDLDLRER